MGDKTEKSFCRVLKLLTSAFVKCRMRRKRLIRPTKACKFIYCRVHVGLISVAHQAVLRFHQAQLPGIARHQKITAQRQVTRTAATLLFACRFGIAEATDGFSPGLALADFAPPSPRRGAVDRDHHLAHDRRRHVAGDLLDWFGFD